MPLPIDRDRIARDAGLRAGDHPLLAEHAVDQGRLAGIGAADDGELERPFGRFRFLFLEIVLALDIGAYRLEQVDQPLAMFGREGDRIAEPQRIGLDQPGLAGLALGLVAHQDHRRVAVAQPARNLLVERGHADPGIDQEQCHVGLVDRSLGLLAHPPRQGLRILILEPGRVDDPEIEAEQGRVAHPAIARHAGPVVDQRQFLADEAIEQGRFADVGPADDGDGGQRGHISKEPW